MPLHLRIMSMASFPLRPMGLIHLSNVIGTPGELRPGADLDLVVCARNYRKTDAGLAFDMDTEISQGGQPVWRETCVFLSRWPDSVQRTGARPPRPPKAPKDSKVLAEFDVSLQTSWSYARVSSDFNPIHLNDRAARFFGLRGAICARHVVTGAQPGGASDGQPGPECTTAHAVPDAGATAGASEHQAVERGGRREACDVRRPHGPRTHVRALGLEPSPDLAVDLSHYEPPLREMRSCRDTLSRFSGRGQGEGLFIPSA